MRQTPQDEDSQAILSLLQCTNSRLGVSGSFGAGSDGAGGGDAAAAGAVAGDAAAGGGSKRRGRDQYSGELDAREVANGFGMGMSSKVQERCGIGSGWVELGECAWFLLHRGPFLFFCFLLLYAGFSGK